MKYIYPVALALAVLIVGAAALLPSFSVSRSVADSSAESPARTPTPGSSSGVSAETYSLTDVSRHASGTSCWTAINGGVYDLTSFISQHPGGEGAILSICGTDGTAAFTGQHGNDRRANAMLATFKIGTLAQ